MFVCLCVQQCLMGFSEATCCCGAVSVPYTSGHSRKLISYTCSYGKYLKVVHCLSHAPEGIGHTLLPSRKLVSYRLVKNILLNLKSPVEANFACGIAILCMKPAFPENVHAHSYTPTVCMHVF